VTGITRAIFPELLGILYEIKVLRGDYVRPSVRPSVLFVAQYQRLNFPSDFPKNFHKSFQEIFVLLGCYTA